MIIFTIIGIVVVVLIIVHYFKESNNSGSSSNSSSGTSYSSRTYSGSSNSPSSSSRVYAPSPSTNRPNVYQSYLKHFPIIKDSIHKAFTEHNYYRHVSVHEIEAELTYFMFFVAVKLSDDRQKLAGGEDLIQFIGSRYDADDMMARVDVYEQIFNGEVFPRVDWGKPVSKYTLMHDERVLNRVYCAFGDFLLNPNCRQDYFNAPSFSGEMWLDSVGFDQYFENEIFEKFADFTQCFPVYIKY